MCISKVLWYAYPQLILDTLSKALAVFFRLLYIISWLIASVRPTARRRDVRQSEATAPRRGMYSVGI